MSIAPILVHAAAPWARLYGDSKLVSTVVAFAHIGGLLLGGGFAIAADRMTLRLARGTVATRTMHLEELHAIHRPVLLGLGVTLLSGLLLLAADLDSYLPAPLFWIKMGVVAALLANGALLQRTESALRRGVGQSDRDWRRLRATAWASLGLWFASVLLGTGLLAI